MQATGTKRLTDSLTGRASEGMGMSNSPNMAIRGRVRRHRLALVETAAARQLAAMTASDARTADAVADTVAASLSDGLTVADAVTAALTGQYGRQATTDRANHRRMVREMNEAHGRIVAVREQTDEGIRRRIAQRYGRIIGDAVLTGLYRGNGLVAQCAAVADAVADAVGDAAVIADAVGRAGRTFARICPDQCKRTREDAAALVTVADATADPVTFADRIAAMVAAMLADGPVAQPDHDPATCLALVCGRCHGTAAAKRYREVRKLEPEMLPTDAAALVAATVGSSGIRPIGAAVATRTRPDGKRRPTIGRNREQSLPIAPVGMAGKSGSVRLIAESSVMGALDQYGHVVKRSAPVTDRTGQTVADGHRDEACEAFALWSLRPVRGSHRGERVEWERIADEAGRDAAVTVARRAAVALADRHGLSPARVADAVGEACEAVGIFGREKREAKRSAVSDAVALDRHVTDRRVDRMGKRTGSSSGHRPNFGTLRPDAVRQPVAVSVLPTAPAALVDQYGRPVAFTGHFPSGTWQDAR